MTNWRNLIAMIGMTLFALWYGGTWAYRSMYQEPRKKIHTQIEELIQGNQNRQETLTHQKNTIEQLRPRNFFQRSLPQPVVSGQNLYHTWLLELVQFCQLENGTVDKGNINENRYYYTLPYYVRGRCSFDQLSRFLYEFYWAPYLHRIVTLEIQPVEQMDLIDVAIRIEGISLQPINQNIMPLTDQLPSGVFRRLASGTLETYTEPINARNLLQFSRGGLDQSDYARVTAISRTDDMPEVWISLQTSDSILRVHEGEQIRIGSFIATLVDVEEPDIVFETRGLSGRPNMRWLITVGEFLKDATAVPPEF